MIQDFNRDGWSSQLTQTGYKITLKNWHLSEPSWGVGHNFVYNGVAGISIGSIDFASLENITIDSPFNAEGFDVIANTNAVINNFQCASCVGLVSTIGTGTKVAEIHDSNIGSLSVASGVSWTYTMLNSPGLINNGTLVYGQDQAGNVTAGGSLSAVGSFTLTNAYGNGFQGGIIASVSQTSTVTGVTITQVVNFVAGNFGSASWNGLAWTPAIVTISGIGITAEWGNASKRLMEPGATTTPLYFLSNVKGGNTNAIKYSLLLRA